MIIYLAGAETWWERFRAAGIRNQLFSYFYLRKQKSAAKTIAALYAQREEWASKGKEFRLFLDSGAFTYQNDRGKKPDPAVYFREFKDFVKRTQDLWTLVAELDIDESDDENLRVDVDQVEAWRDELYEVRGQANILPVWHATRGHDKWVEYCNDPRFPYLAFSSRVDQLGSKNKLCAQAHAKGKKVHGFAETKLQTEAKYLKCDSVDSSTWLRATKFGGMFIFQSNQLRILDHKHKSDRRLFRAYFKNIGIDYDIITQDEAKLKKDTPEYTAYQEELTRASLIAWRNLSERYEQFGGSHGRERPQLRTIEGVINRVRHAANDREAAREGSIRAGDADPRSRAGRRGTEMVDSRSSSPDPSRDGGSQPRWFSSQSGTDQGAGRQAEQSHAGAARDPASGTPGTAAQDLLAGGTFSMRSFRLKKLPGGKLAVDPDQAKEVMPEQPTYLPRVFEPAQKELIPAVPVHRARNDKSEVLNAHPMADDKLLPTVPNDAQSAAQGSDPSGAAAEPGPSEQTAGWMAAIKVQGIQPIEPTCARSYCGHPKSDHENGKPCKGCMSMPGMIGGCGIFLEAGAEGKCSCTHLPETHTRENGGCAIEGCGCLVYQDHAHVEKNDGYPLVHENGSSPIQGPGEPNPSPSEGKSTITATVEGKRHLPVLQGPTVQHSPSALAGLELMDKTLPKLGCNNCAMQGECPEYQENALCYFEATFKSLNVRDLDHHKAQLEWLLTQDWERTIRAVTQERISAGGMLDPRVGSQIDAYMSRLSQFRELFAVKPASVTASVTVTGAGAVQSGQGIISKLFGGSMPATDLEIDNIPGRQGDVIDVPSQNPALSRSGK
jgi:hypothetical protein